MQNSQARHFMETVARREANAQRPGVLYEAETGLTYDGHAIDARTGELAGGPRNWSAASKESLDVALLVKALQGDRIARLAISPTGKPNDAVPIALDRLSRKITTYEAFNHRYPGFGGFLPWFKVAGKPGARRMEPMPDWKDRVPALDNGQLAWSLYYAGQTLTRLGYADLGKRYLGHFNLMSQNVVRIFYDPTERALRAEARLSNAEERPERNAYAVNAENAYYLKDAAEGLMMVHFADLFGHWRQQPGGQEALWAAPRREPTTFTTSDGKDITVVKGWRFSSHEDWGFLVLPMADDPVAAKLFANGQRVRAAFAAEQGRPGLYASTHRPVEGNRNPRYESRVGIPGPSTSDTRALPIYAPYAAFPLALVDKGVFATWLQNMLKAPRMFGPYGIGESFDGSGDKIAPVLTWDGKALPLLAYDGGIVSDIRQYLKADGLYDRFMQRVRDDYRNFDGKPIEGTDYALRTPTVGVPQNTSDFRQPSSAR